MMGEAGGEQAPGIGARLRAARERRGLTVLQAAERLHVDARVLEALEAEDFGVLGADVYVRGHLRRYAEAVGEAPAQLQELYAASVRSVCPDLTRIPRATSGERASPLTLPALLLVVAVALLGLLWWFLSIPADKARPAQLSPAAPAAGTALAPAPAAGASAAPAPAAPGSGAAPKTAVPPPTSTTEAQLAVRFAALSWVEISDADGRRLLHGLFAAGGAREVTGRAPLRVVLGNAPAVDLELNGRPVTIAGLVHRNGSAYLLIDSAGHASPAAPRLAHGY